MMEEYSTEEEEEDDKQEDLHEMDTSRLSWRPYIRFYLMRAVRTSLFTCDFLGEKFASLLGLNVSKYQYAIDEYYRAKSEEGDSDEDGEEVPQMQEVNGSNEGEHIQCHDAEYGTMNLKKQTDISQRSTVSNISEVPAAGCENHGYVDN
ncbi:protein FAM177A1 isoform X2 [Latimeria chalumnae]|nr:PREDICTED: protein FAM177B isoform X2 [Latimeria chalumnae]XP_014343890.1 PREDICTED: protein FAM177B isoform X2 [Latimeria chalumnae]|eukprot:XP_005996080.1 PREDICTED: protein FAM177B isoform X2 [Latimeria chalumnae]